MSADFWKILKYSSTLEGVSKKGCAWTTNPKKDILGKCFELLNDMIPPICGISYNIETFAN